MYKAENYRLLKRRSDRVFYRSSFVDVATDFHDVYGRLP